MDRNPAGVVIANCYPCEAIPVFTTAPVLSLTEDTEHTEEGFNLGKEQFL